MLGKAVSVDLGAGESLLLLAHSGSEPSVPSLPIEREFDQTIDINDGWEARVLRHYRAGLHDFEIEEQGAGRYKSVKLGRWETAFGLGSDFSGHVSYRRTVELPESLSGRRLVLDLGCVEYAGRVSVDGKEIGTVLWNPLRIDLPAAYTKAKFSLRIDVSNTLANELTSSRVIEEWKKRKGPGWPSTYHARALDFEKDSRGGGLLGPVRLRVGAVPESSRRTQNPSR